MFKDEKQAIDVLIKVCNYMKWDIAVPNGPEDGEVPGLIIGNDEYLEDVLDYVPSHTKWSKNSTNG